MFTSLLVSLGFSRDDVTWVWLQIVAVAGLILSNVFDVRYWAGYVGVTLSETALHRVIAAASLIAWIGGKYQRSTLPASNDSPSGSGYMSNFTKPLGAVVLAVGLSFGMVGATGCAKAQPTVTPSSTPPQHHVLTVQEQALRVLHAVRDVGTIVEKVQAAEIELHDGGAVPDATHVMIQLTFQKIAASIITATDSLQHATEATDLDGVVQALTVGIDDLAGRLARLNTDQSKQLSGWLKTAAALIELALS